MFFTLLTIVFFLTFIGVSQNLSDNISNAASLPKVKPIKEKSELKEVNRKDILQEKENNNDQVIGIFLSKLSKKDPTITYLFAGAQNVPKKSTKKENSIDLDYIVNYITEDNKKELVNCVISNVKRSDTIDTYHLKFTISDEKHNETDRMVKLKVNSQSQIVEIK